MSPRSMNLTTHPQGKGGLFSCFCCNLRYINSRNCINHDYFSFHILYFVIYSVCPIPPHPVPPLHFSLSVSYGFGYFDDEQKWHSRAKIKWIIRRMRTVSRTTTIAIRLWTMEKIWNILWWDADHLPAMDNSYKRHTCHFDTKVQIPVIRTVPLHSDYSWWYNTVTRQEPRGNWAMGICTSKNMFLNQDGQGVQDDAF
jgi:hypothetical protein